MPSLKLDLLVDSKNGRVALQQFANETDAAFKKSAAAISKVSLSALPEHERAVIKVKRQYENLQAEVKKIAASGRISQEMANQWHTALGVRMQDDLRKLEPQGKRTFEGIAASAKAAAVAAATAVAALAGREIVQSTIGMERFENSLKSATGSSMQATREMAFIREEANRLGLELMATGKGFVTIAASAKGTELAGQGVRDIFSATSEAAAVLGLSADETNGALLAISQMISKGKVSAEELRGQLGERLPGAFQIAARAMGVTTQELDKMLQKGEIVATDFLPRFAEEMHKTFGPDLETAAGRSEAAFNRLKNSITDLKVAIGNSGLLDSLAKLADIGSKSIQGWIFLGSTTTNAGKEFFQGEELDRYYAADLATRKKMLDHAAQVRSLQAMTTAPPQLGEVGIDPMIAAQRAKDKEEAEKKLKKQQTAAKQLADQWESTSASLNKDIRLGGLDGLDKELATITIRAEEMRKQFGNKELIDAWQADAENVAIQADYTKRLTKEQQDLLKVTEAYHDMQIAALPEEQRGIAKLNDEYNAHYAVVADMLNAGKITVEQAMADNETLASSHAEAIDKIKNKTGDLTEFQKQAYQSMQSSAAGFFESIRTGNGNMLENFTDTIWRMADQWAAAQAMMGLFGQDFGKGGSLGGLVGWAFGGVTDALKFHSGGVVGETAAPAMSVSPSLFVGAPRFHSGLMPDEFPAILQKGETVIPRGGFAAGGGITVNIIESQDKGGQVNRRTDSNGNQMLEIFVAQVKGSIARDIVSGDGVIPSALNSTYGVSRVAGAY
jgi:tape measure domain-containing protein